MGSEIAVLSSNESAAEQIGQLAPEGAELGWVDSTQSVEDQAAQLDGTVAVLLVEGRFPLELARACPSVRLLQVFSAGTDRLDKQALGELGITVANNGGGNAVAVSEHTVTMMVTVFRRLQLQYASVRARNWASDLSSSWGEEVHELTDKTVGIVGFGRIGQQVAKRLQGWDCDIIYHDTFTIPAKVEERLHATKVPLDELLSTSDIVTLHMPLNGQTRGMISDRELDLMKPTAVLVNECRGPVVDEAALIRALQQGKIAAAGLDVLEEEPTSADNPLLAMENVVVTPHMAGTTVEAREKAQVFGIGNAMRVAAGGEPESVVPPD
jgi:glyoxylate reductase/D-3-phosphoglycerate dehydrogenase